MKKTVSMMLLAFMIVTTGTGFANASSTAGDYLATINQYMELGEYAKVQQYAEDFLDNFTPTPAERAQFEQYRQYAQAQQQLAAGQYPGAEVNFKALSASQFLDSEAFWHYTEGRSAEAQGLWDAAIEAYTQSGSVMDSTGRLAACYQERDRIIPDKPSSITLLDSKADEVSIHVFWEDSREGNEYTVLYAPEGMQPSSVETAGFDVALSGLIPNTTYDVTVRESVEGTQVSAKYNTAAATPVQGNVYSVDSIVVGRYTQTDLYSRGIRELVSRDKYEEMPTAGAPIELSVSQDSMINYGFGYLMYAKLQFDLSENKPQKVKTSVVMRLTDGGVFAHTTEQEMQSAYIVRVYQTLDSLLDACYYENKGWPESNGRIEFYINDQLAGAVPMKLVEY